MSDRDLPRREVGQFQHLAPMRDLLEELTHVNDRIMTGDITSAKAAMQTKWVKDIMDNAERRLRDEGADQVSLELYAAASGWIGLTWAYGSTAGGFTLLGSVVPRRR
jgi:hypothetical protein